MIPVPCSEIVNEYFSPFLQQHEASCFLELPEQNQRWLVSGEKLFVLSPLTCVKFRLCYLKCHVLTLILFLFCFFIRLGEAVTSGRAGAWAPALWISTLETEQQAVYLLICSPTQRGSFLWLLLWAIPITNNTTRQPPIYPPSACQHLTQRLCWSSLHIRYNWCVFSSLFLNPVCCFFGLPETHCCNFP